MLLDRIESKGLAHYSYIIGDEGESIVIDPRRDCDVYIEMASKGGFRIVHILETHRNEDYAIGSVELASRTNAQAWHADEQLGYKYGQPARDGQIWKIGELKLQAVHCPGHTPGSMSYLLHEPGGAPWVLFTGDALFAGDVGRVDLLGLDRMREMAGMLYGTIFNKIIPLGDEVILCPAHGAGSACGKSIAKRVWTTIGLERRLNPKLQFTERDAFIANVAMPHEVPPYFLHMEVWNIEGPPLLNTLPTSTPLPADLFSEKAKNGIILDIRTPLSFGASHIPGALSIWLEGLPNFAGWFLPYDMPILLVSDTHDLSEAVRYLVRLGYDKVAGYLSDGMLAWHMAGKESRAIKTMSAQELCREVEVNKDYWILDVRSEEELETEGRIKGAHHIHITQLPSRLKEIPKDCPICVFCHSGSRSMIAASILQREGWIDLSVVSGGLAGWNSINCSVKL